MTELFQEVIVLCFNGCHLDMLLNKLISSTQFLCESDRLFCVVSRTLDRVHARAIQERKREELSGKSVRNRQLLHQTSKATWIISTRFYCLWLTHYC